MSGKILVVDDEPLILNTIERALTKKGYEVSTASDAEAFLQRLGEYGPDLIILDINLGGVNSETLLGRIRHLAPRVKVLFMSGVIPHVSIEHFIEKPFRLDELRERVRHMLECGDAG